MKVAVKMEKRTDTRGQVLAHVARLGNVQAEGPTPKLARVNLAIRIERYCSEESWPEVRLDRTGAVHVAYRGVDGDWELARFWRNSLDPDFTSGCVEQMIGAGSNRADAVKALEAAVEADVDDFGPARSWCGGRPADGLLG